MKQLNVLAAAVAVMTLLVACGTAEERAADYLVRAQQAYTAEDYVKAELEVKNALQIEPTNVDALYLRGQIAEKDRDYAQMYANLSRVIELDAQHIDAHLGLAQIYLLAKSTDRAAGEIDAALAIDPKNRTARVLKGALMNLTGQPAEAQQLAREVLEEDPGDAGANTLMTAIIGDTDPGGALESLDEGIEHNPTEASLRLLKISLLRRLGRSEEVEAELKRVIDMQPEASELRYALARFYTESERLDDAEGVYRKMIADDPEDFTARLRLAEFLANHRDPAAAEKALQAFISKQPELYAFQFALARLYRQTDRGREADEIYQRIIEADDVGPAGLESRNQLAERAVAGGDTARANALLAEVLAKEPANASALLTRARIRLNQGDARGATADLRGVLRSNPASQDALLLLSQAHLRNGERDLAEESLRQLLQINPAHLDAKFALAQLLMESRDWPRAERYLRELVAAHPDHVGATRLLVEALYRQRNLEDAEKFARAILERDKALGTFLLGRIYQVGGRTDESIAAYKASLEAEPAGFEPLASLIAAWVKNGQSDAAHAFLLKHVEAHPDQAHAWTLLGALEVERNDLEAAKTALHKAIDVNPAWLPAYQNLAGVLLREKDGDAAIRIVQRGGEAAPKQPEFKLLLAQTYEQAGRQDEAIRTYESLLDTGFRPVLIANNFAALVADFQMQPERLQKARRVAEQLRESDEPPYLDTLGWVHYRLGEYEQAVPLLEQAAAKRAGSPTYQYHLGMAYLGAGRNGEARTALEQALADKSADFRGIDEARKALADLK